MSDALRLPPQPNLEQYKNLARDFQRACKAGSDEAILNWAKSWVENLAQLRGLQPTDDVRQEIQADIWRVARRWHKLRKSNERASECLLADAQLLIARCHGFASWPKFAQHLEELARAKSDVSRFEQAADAIASGDIDTLRRLLREDPELVRARSTREHGSTLLHYVSANGIEDFRQKTPPNIVEITKLLLDAGADARAESDAYAGRSTTLGLAATSCHPEAAGVQQALIDLLLDRGATLDGPDTKDIVLACLHNGRGDAAADLASRGAQLDLEGAAGVGRLDVVRPYFAPDGSLRPPATVKQLMDGFAWACQFGRTEVVAFLLDRGAELEGKLPHDGQTGLHWAAYGGYPETVKLLLDRGARVDAVDQNYGGTPLGWALYQWGGAPREGHYQVVAMLTHAGAKLDASWFEVDDYERQRTIRKLRSDPRMQAALGQAG
jgi:ankyrin repeat protein